MWRDRPLQSHTLIENLILYAFSQSAHDGCVVVLLDSRLNRFPVTHSQFRAIAMHQRGSYNGLANSHIRSGDEQASEHNSSRSHSGVLLQRFGQSQTEIEDRFFVERHIYGKAQTAGPGRYTGRSNGAHIVTLDLQAFDDIHCLGTVAD